MNETTKDKIKEIFFDNVKLSYGCTEPVAVGISVAVGKKYVRGDVKHIEVVMDRNTYKNGLEVGIPGTHFRGFDLAIALAYTIGDANLGLEVFKNVTSEAVEEAIALKEIVSVKYENDNKLHIRTKIFAENEVTVEITDSHDNVSKITVDGTEIYNTQTTVSFKRNLVKSITLNDIFDYVEEPNEDVVKVVKEAIDYNLKAGEEGINLDGNFGSVFFNYIDLSNNQSIETYIKSFVAAGVDLRMSGFLKPIMTVAGSGNQGISCVIPPALYGFKNLIKEEKIIQAVLLSMLTTIYIKAYSGVLTPVCGAGSIASAGSSAGITYLMGGDREQIKNAINNVLATLFGMICDGAKRGCALKTSVGAQMAINASLLAMRNTNIPCGNGFAAKDVEITIKRIELLTNSLRQFDQDVIDFIGHC